MNRLIYDQIEVDNYIRDYILYFPSELKPDAPLVFVVHGYTDNAKNMMDSTKMNEIADKYNFAVCYPQGLKDDNNDSFWQVYYDFTEHITINDVSFFKTLATYLQETYKLSRDNTFVTGMSNGGDMSILLGLVGSDTFKAIAPVCGSLLVKNIKESKPTPFIPSFFINSTKDSITFWEGDMENKGGWGKYLSSEDMVKLFVDKDETLTKVSENLPDIDKNDGSYIVFDKYFNTHSNNQIWFYKVIDGDHDWPGDSGNKDINASFEVWKFFSQFI